MKQHLSLPIIGTKTAVPPLKKNVKDLFFWWGGGEVG